MRSRYIINSYFCNSPTEYRTRAFCTATNIETILCTWRSGTCFTPFVSFFEFKGLKDIEILFHVNICQRDSSSWPRIVVGRRLSMSKWKRKPYRGCCSSLFARYSGVHRRNEYGDRVKVRNDGISKIGDWYNPMSYRPVAPVSCFNIRWSELYGNR